MEKSTYILKYEFNKSCKKVLYLASSTIPKKICGYSVRTHFIVKHLISCNIHVICLNKPILSRNGDNNIKKVNYDTVTYHYLNTNKAHFAQIDNIYTKEYINIYIDYINNIIKECGKPDVIHACSDYVNPFVGYKIGKKYNIPLVYEIRGLWHLSRLSRDKKWKGTDSYKKYTYLEKKCYDKSDYIFVISQELKKLVIKYCNRNRNKVLIVPNCIDSNTWLPMGRNKILEKKYKLGSNVIFGYVGSVVNYEGLDYLLRAMQILKKKSIKCKLIIVGKGFTNTCQLIYDKLKNLARKLRIRECVIFTGNIDFSEIKKYYSIIDVICLPRKGFQVCELVTPLKPFEAMSMEKAIIASDVGPLKRNIINNKTGLIHKKDSVQSLARQMKKIIDDPKLIKILGRQARKWVVQNKQWHDVISEIIRTYDKLIHTDFINE